ncbi:MAG: hypothetical protein HY720_10905 [Planctomycetes bacterium]|nr:hypothetical protein [Planctomycetota bacterium]
MAVRIRIELLGPDGRCLRTAAILNGGFEVPGPHLLLPRSCAERLLGAYRTHAVRQVLDAAGGSAEFWAVDLPVGGCVTTDDRKGPLVEFRVLVSEGDSELLVSDSGIDALGVRIESFEPGRWRFDGETRVRPTEAAEYW